MDPLTKSDVTTLIGHAELLRRKGETDMPKYFVGLAARIADTLGDEDLQKRCRELDHRPTGQPIEYADDELRGRAWARRD